MKNQLNIGGIDFKIINIIKRDKIALKLLVLIITQEDFFLVKMEI